MPEKEEKSNSYDYATADWLNLLEPLSRNINLASPGRNLSDLLETLIKQLMTDLRIDAIAIWTIEKETNFMQIEVSVGLSEQYVRFFNKTDRIRAGQGLVGRVMSDSKTLSIQNLEEYKGIGLSRWNDMMKMEGLTAILAAPMFVSSQTVGAFNIYYKEPHIFSPQEKIFIEIISNQVAIIIENDKNYRLIIQEREKLKNQVDKLLQMEKVTEFLNLHYRDSIDSTLKFLADYITEKFGAKGLTILQKNEKENTLAFTASHGVSEKLVEFIKAFSPKPGPDTFAGIAFLEKKPVFTSRLMTDSRINKDWRIFMSEEKWVAVATFPLITRGEAIGAWEVLYDHYHEFIEDEIGILNILAHFIGISLENIKVLNSLVAEKDKSQSMLNSLHDGIIVYDLNKNIIAMNPRAEELLLVKKESILDTSVATLANASDVLLKNIASISVLPLEDFEEREVTLASPFNIVLKITQLPLKNESNIKVGSMKVLHDATSEKAVERLKASFVSIASHEMRTPLTIIRGNAELLKEKLDATPVEMEAVRKMTLSVEANSIKLLRIVNDFLDVSRIEGGYIEFKKEKFNVVALLENTVSELKKSAEEKRLSLAFEPPSGELPEAFADQNYSEQIVINLISNAIHYTEKGGVTVSAEREDGFIKIRVSDTGVGIEKAEWASLFQKFSTVGRAFAHSKEYGSGLGLYIARILAESMGGKIALEQSIPGKGSVFSVSLPAAA